MSIASIFGGGISWLWTGISQAFNISRWFSKNAFKLKGLWITAAVAALKVSYDAVVTGINEAIERLSAINITEQAQTAASDFIALANTVAPLEEALACLVGLIHLGAACLIVRAIRSFRMRIFG